MKCSLSSKNSPRNTVDFEAACSVYIRFRGVNGYRFIELRFAGLGEINGLKRELTGTFEETMRGQAYILRGGDGKTAGKVTGELHNLSPWRKRSVSSREDLCDYILSHNQLYMYMVGKQKAEWVTTENRLGYKGHAVAFDSTFCSTSHRELYFFDANYGVFHHEDLQRDMFLRWFTDLWDFWNGSFSYKGIFRGGSRELLSYGRAGGLGGAGSVVVGNPLFTPKTKTMSGTGLPGGFDMS